MDKIKCVCPAEIAGSLWLGAQATNAEAIPFIGRAEQALLLHFWPLTVLIFVPVFVDDEGKSFIGRRSEKDSDPHYAIAIPEVSDVKEFVLDYRLLLSQLRQSNGDLFRPVESLIDLPDQGALVFLQHLAALGKEQLEASEIRFSVASVE